MEALYLHFLCHNFIHLASYPMSTSENSRRKSGRDVKLSTRLHLALRLRMEALYLHFFCLCHLASYPMGTEENSPEIKLITRLHLVLRLRMAELYLHFLCHNLIHLASHPMGTRENSPEEKRLGREADHSPYVSAIFLSSEISH
jgi:hypothetical protein